MPLVKAKCPNCGANLQVNSEKDAAICPYCKSAYIVEKSIASFNNSKVDKIVANTVNIYGNQTIQAYKNSDDTKFVNNKVSKGFLINIRVAEQLRGAIQQLYCRSLIYLKSDGTLGLDTSKDASVATELDPNIFLWKNIKKFCVVTNEIYTNHYTDDCGYDETVIALTYDGRFLVSKPMPHYYWDRVVALCANKYGILESWNDIEDFEYYNGLVALTKSGNVISPDIKGLEGWENISKIGKIGNGIYGFYGFYGIDQSGSVHISTTNLKQYQVEEIKHWKNVCDIDIADNYNGHILGLREDGKILTTDIDDKYWNRLSNIVSLQRGTAIRSDGTVFSSNKMISPGNGYVQVSNSYYHGKWKCREFLTESGRVDRESERAVQEGVLSICECGDKFIYIGKDGSFNSPYGNGKRNLLLPDQKVFYGNNVSAPINDNISKRILSDSWRHEYAERERALKQVGLFNKGRPYIKERLEFIKSQMKILNLL